jgi:hypothetical protein
MKFETKHYFEISMLPIIMLPVIALTVGITLWCAQPATGKFVPDPQFTYNLKNLHPDPGKLAHYNDLPEPDTDYCERAVFGFTGDTVLALNGPTYDEVPEGLQKVLYKDRTGVFKMIDLPLSEIKVLETDSTGTGQ